MGNDATTRREFSVVFLSRHNLISGDEFFNDRLREELKAKPDTGSIAPREVCKKTRSRKNSSR